MKAERQTPDEQCVKIAQQMATIYREYFGDALVVVYLYGSRARGDYSDGSDLDIAAIVRGERKNLQQTLLELLNKSNRIGLENDIIISPNVIPYDEFQSMQNVLPYYRNIFEEGVEIVA